MEVEEEVGGAEAHRGDVAGLAEIEAAEGVREVEEGVASALVAVVVGAAPPISQDLQEASVAGAHSPRTRCPRRCISVLYGLLYERLLSISIDLFKMTTLTDRIISSIGALICACAMTCGHQVGPAPRHVKRPSSCPTL